MKVRFYATGMFLCLAGVVFAGQTTFSVDCNQHFLSFEQHNGMTVVHGPELALPGDEPGTPWLPARFVNVLIPSGAVATGVTVKADEELLRAEIVLAPVQPPQRRNAPLAPPVPPDAAAYAVDARVPGEAAVLCGTHNLRGHTMASVRVNPLRYNAARKELWHAPRLDVTVLYAEAPQAAVAPADRHDVFGRMAETLAINPSQRRATAPQARAAVAGQVDYLLITAQALSNAFHALAAHRTARGLNSAIISTETISSAYSGIDIQQKIRACIAEYVATKGTVYVVLGGDDTMVPDRDCYVTCAGETESAMPTDLYYSGLDGTWNADGDSRYGETTDGVDMAPDVIVGRIPVRTAAQASAYINKVIAFENNRPEELMQKMLVVGTETWDTYSGTGRPSDMLGDGHAEFRASNHPYVSDAEIWSRRMYRDGITQYWRAAELKYFFDTLTSWDGATAGDYLQNAANVQSKMNLGWGHVYFSDHGFESGWGIESGTYGSSDAAALNNRVVIVYTDACLTGHFDGSPEPCFSESILRNANGGALVYIGCSRYGWGSPGSYDGGASSVYAYKFYRRLFEPQRIASGAAFAQHKADMIAQSGANGAERWIQFGLNFQGDPAIMVGVVETNKMPVLEPVARQIVLAGDVVQFTVQASDPADSDMITLSAAGVPAWAVWSTVSNKGSVSGVFSGTPPQPGFAEVVFTARDKDGATSITVRITAGAPGICRDLLISEYGEGTSYNKYLELFNGTSNAVDLSQYCLRNQVNGAGPYTNELALSGTLPPDTAYLIVYNQADAALREKADMTAGSLCLAFNGNDAVALFRRGAPDIQLDEAGVFGSTAYWGQDVTLLRRWHVTLPRIPYDPEEWLAEPVNSWDDAGGHVVIPEPGVWCALAALWVLAQRRSI